MDATTDSGDVEENAGGDKPEQFQVANSGGGRQHDAAGLRVRSEFSNAIAVVAGPPQRREGGAIRTDQTERPVAYAPCGGSRYGQVAVPAFRRRTLSEVGDDDRNGDHIRWPDLRRRP